jgi:hypothetical protein
MLPGMRSWILALAYEGRKREKLERSRARASTAGSPGCFRQGCAQSPLEVLFELFYIRLTDKFALILPK